MAPTRLSERLITAWHERAGEVTRSASVEDGSAAELTFSLPLTDPE